MNKNLPVICIVGEKGRMGQWFSHFFKSHHIPIVSINRTDPPEKTKQTIQKANITMVSVPIAKTEEVIKLVAKYIRQDALLTDITSLKVMPLKAMENAPSATLGMHPLFGPSMAVPKGQKIVFCHQKDNKYVTFLKELFESSGMQVIKMSGEEHDYHMAYIQGLTHALNLIYAKIIFDQKDALSKKLDTPLFMLQSLVMGRVLHQDLELSRDMQMYNPYFLPLMENMAAYSDKLLSVVQKGDAKAFVRLFVEDQQRGKEFANFSVLHTDKVLKLVSEVHAAPPEKVSVLYLLPKTVKIAYLGPEGTYSHQAVVKVFGKSSKQQISCNTIFTVFNSVLQRDTEFGIVPAENSLEGTVKGTLDYLVDFSLVVVGSFAIPIHHQLASREKSLKEVTTVVSHPQALAQCEKWLRTNLPDAKVTPSTSTTAEVQKPQKKHAYICSETAASLYHLPIIARNIEDDPYNMTRFYVLAKKQTEIKGLNNKKTLIFLTVYNRVGILRDILNIFASHGINLTKLESRPSQEKIWDYHFFVEADETYNSKRLLEALKELETYCPVIRILGRT